MKISKYPGSLNIEGKILNEVAGTPESLQNIDGLRNIDGQHL
jgi:hypothetical protein